MEKNDQPTPGDRTIRALGLCSGGLDSMLAAMVLRDQGIHVAWITFETPFFSARKARSAARMIDIPLSVQNITPVYLTMLKSPPAGYGKNMNPCMDCHALMFRLAAERMRQKGFHFLFSGEVLGQRPMSQNKPSLRYVEKHSGADGYILRPLSARCLPETLPEQRGWVDRGRLLDISGRSRKRQIELADAYGIHTYPTPAGGCLLTDKGYSARLRDLFAHGESVTENDLHLLRHGRHFRLSPEAKIIAGRTRQDNDAIRQYADPNTHTIFHAVDFPGPTVVLSSADAGRDDLLTAAAIAAGYSKAPNDRPARVQVSSPSGSETVAVLPMTPADAKPYLL